MLYYIAERNLFLYSVQFAKVMFLRVVSHGRILVRVDGHVQLVPYYPHKHTFAEAKGQICCRE